MILFRKRKVKKLLEAYEQEFNREISEELIAYDELQEMKQLRLAEIAAEFDLLEGHKYTTTIPQLSHYVPNSIDLMLGYNKIINLIYKLKNAKFVEKDEYAFYPEGFLFLEPDATICWKVIPDASKD